VYLQSIQRMIPTARDELEVSLALGKASRVDRPHVLAPRPLSRNESRRGQYVQVLCDSLARGVEAAGKNRDRCRPAL